MKITTCKGMLESQIMLSVEQCAQACSGRSQVWKCAHPRACLRLWQRHRVARRRHTKRCSQSVHEHGWMLDSHVQMKQPLCSSSNVAYVCH